MTKNVPVKVAPTPAELSDLAAKILTIGPPGVRLLQRWRPYICPFHELLPMVPRGSRQLDLGCGAGLFLSLLAASGRIQSGRGFDLSAKAIAVAQGNAATLSQRGCDGRLAFATASVAEPWPDEPYDVISMIDLMHHLPAGIQSSLVGKAAGHLRPGGLLLYKDMVRRPFWRAWANRIHDLILARQWIRYLPIEEVERQASEAGLELVERRTVNMLWYGHEIRLFRKPRKDESAHRETPAQRHKG